MRGEAKAKRVNRHAREPASGTRVMMFLPVSQTLIECQRRHRLTTGLVMTTLRGICLRSNIDLRQFERSKVAWCLKSADKAGMLREGILQDLARRDSVERDPVEDPVEDPDEDPDPVEDRYDEWTPRRRQDPLRLIGQSTMAQITSAPRPSQKRVTRSLTLSTLTRKSTRSTLVCKL